MYPRGDGVAQSYELINPPTRDVLSMRLNGYQGAVPKNLRHDRNVPQNQYISEQISNDPEHVQRHADLNLRMRNPLFHEFHYKKLIDPQYSIPQHKHEIQSWQSPQQPDSLDIFTQNLNARQQNKERGNKGNNLMNYDNTTTNSHSIQQDHPSMLPPQQYSAAHQPNRVVGSPQQSLPLRAASMISLQDYSNNNNIDLQNQRQSTDLRSQNNNNMPQSRHSQQSNSRLGANNNNNNNPIRQSSPQDFSYNQPPLQQDQYPPVPRNDASRQGSQQQSQQYPPVQQQQSLQQQQQPSSNYDNHAYQQYLQQQEQKLMNQMGQAEPQQIQQQFDHASAPQQQQQQQQFQQNQQSPQYQQQIDAHLQQQQGDLQPRYSSSPSILNDKRMRKIYNPLVQKVSAVYEPRYGVDVQFNGYKREQFRNWEDKNNHYHNIIRSKNHLLGQYADYSTGNHEYGTQKRYP